MTGNSVRPAGVSADRGDLHPSDGAARTGAGDVFQSLPVAERYELAPLSDRSAAGLLAVRFPALDPRLRARLVAEAQGNPLALLELPTQLGGSRPYAGTLPGPLPLTERLRAVFAARLDELDGRTRQVLLLAALESSGRLDVLERAASAQGGLRSLEDAERLRLIEIDDATRSVRFRHSLVRGAVVGASTHAERRQAHQALAMILHAHYWLAVHYFRTGEWQLSLRHLSDELITAAAPFVSLTGLLKDMRALVAAARGEDDLHAVLDEERVAWAEPRHSLGTLHALHQAAGLGALGRGDWETAFRRLALISPPGTLAPHAQRALTTCLDLVEAALRSGRRTEALAHAAVLQTAGIAAVSPRLAMLVAASAALVADDDAVAADGFERALALPEIEDWPFDLARVRLMLGERLRRRAPSEARSPLRAALATFERLGAVPWIRRARAELLATGETRAVPGDGPRVELTAQEWQIAELAASGLTNREIGARLFLSHRTVGSHLHHLFPKLGVTSRAALRDALNRRDSGP